MFSGFLVDGPESWLNVEPLHVFFFCEPAVLFSVNSKLFSLGELQLLLLRRTSSVLFFCELQALLNRRTSTVLIAVNFECSCCCELHWAYYVELNFSFMSLSTLDSTFTLNSEIPLLILILCLCLPNILRESSPYFLIFCINLFTTSTINCVAEIVMRKNFLHLL